MKKIIASVLLGMGVVVTAAEIELKVAGDANILKSTPDTNYGAESFLAAFGGPDESADARKAYLKFDAAGIEGKITDVALEIMYISKYDRCATVYVLEGAQADEWNEQTLTWNNAPGNDPSSNFNLKEAEGVKMIELGSVCGNGRYNVAPFEFRDAKAKAALLYTLNEGNRTTTLVLVQGPNSRARVFAVAAKEDENFAPPTLKLSVGE